MPLPTALLQVGREALGRSLTGLSRDLEKLHDQTRRKLAVAFGNRTGGWFHDVLLAILLGPAHPTNEENNNAVEVCPTLFECDDRPSWDEEDGWDVTSSANLQPLALVLRSILFCLNPDKRKWGSLLLPALTLIGDWICSRYCQSSRRP